MNLLGSVLRAYVLRFPIARGKGLVLRTIAVRLPLEAREFETVLPGGGKVTARWDEVVGRKLLREGAFEPVEARTLVDMLSSGETAFDVGANIGLLTIPLALTGARVVAVEPLPANIERLRRNLERNALDNVVIVEAACGASDGEAVLHAAADAAFGSLHEVVKYRAASDLAVRVRSLDSLWHELDRPQIKLVKIDVEGAELEVLDGAREMLDATGPSLMVEADAGDASDALRQHLGPLGYRELTPAGFGAGNHLFAQR